MTDFLDARLKAPRICSPASRLLFSYRSSVKFRSTFPPSALTFASLVFPFFSFSDTFSECFSAFHPSLFCFFVPFLLRLLFFLFLSFFCFSKTTTPFFFFPNPISRFPMLLAKTLLPDFPVLLRNCLFRFFYSPIFLFLFRRLPAFFRLLPKLTS